jgi:hypothetical protein
MSLCFSPSNSLSYLLQTQLKRKKSKLFKNIYIYLKGYWFDVFYVKNILKLTCLKIYNFFKSILKEIYMYLRLSKKMILIIVTDEQKYSCHEIKNISRKTVRW